MKEVPGSDSLSIQAEHTAVLQCSAFPVEEQGGYEDRFSYCSLCSSPSPSALAERQRHRAKGAGSSASDQSYWQLNINTAMAYISLGIYFDLFFILAKGYT